MAKNRNQKRFGLFYRSNGRWTTTPYGGFTFTAYQANRNPVKGEISELKNYLLKSRVRVCPVAA
jgi:hypothetical protein